MQSCGRVVLHPRICVLWPCLATKHVGHDRCTHIPLKSSRHRVVPSASSRISWARHRVSLCASSRIPRRVIAFSSARHRVSFSASSRFLLRVIAYPSRHRVFPRHRVLPRHRGLHSHHCVLSPRHRVLSRVIASTRPGRARHTVLRARYPFFSAFVCPLAMSCHQACCP